jgi:hypothetical protein
MHSRHIVAVVIMLVAPGSMPAEAATSSFDFAGSGVTGSFSLTYAPNPNVGGPLGTSPNTFDPVGSFIITGASGSFSDANIGLSTTITGVVPRSPASPDATNLLAPASFGHYIVANGVPGPGGLAPGFSYDNLFYPGGSPQTATDYPFHGGFLDIYGLVFSTTGGFAVNFWSNGDFGGGVTYGAGVTDGVDVLDYVGGIAVSSPVPEPATWAMMIAGFGLAGAAIRYRRRSFAVSWT